mgnify:CR=1 FL=1
MAKQPTPITDPRDVPPTARPVHGLPKEGDVVDESFAITQELILPVKDAASLKAAEEKLAKQSWSDRVEWVELGQLSLDTKPATDSTGGSSGGSATARAITLGGNTSIAETRNKGFFNLQAAFERGLKTEFEEEKDVSREIMEATQQTAKDALASILPSQAFLFVPPDELFRAQQEAEKLARDFAKECLGAQKNPDKDAMNKGGKSNELKSSLGRKLRGLSLRHDGRMHIFPYSQQYAPETGIATVAAIESRYQSITGDHGRVGAPIR